ncbi:MlaE family ABC transporter permease [Hyphococcus luteus]|uniref:ABC transporter permease n=1 Tax=Hyphococcus luteus TaxID=2058213 RepID=A0A2S7JZI8_9PROT|nr:ABC transporter permease [Marinicaulis flavus]PQA85669.1 ABC transporter permease [Marinicaulis flavus]
MNIFALTGSLTIEGLRETGRMAQFAGRGAVAGVLGPFYWRAFFSSLMRIGFTSLPVVGLTAVFTGAALALNIYDGSLRFNAETFLPQILSVSIVRELGPVLAALMVAGRCASAMAAEIGTMRVTEQIDAMSTLSVDPFKYLIAPRIAATTIALPILVLIADIIGIYGGYLVAVYGLDFSGPVFIRNIAEFIENRDTVSGLIKAAAFGFLIAVMGCYYGYRSRGGAQGVGAATRTAVVAAAVAILASNYVMTSFMVEF